MVSVKHLVRFAVCLVSLTAASAAFGQNVPPRAAQSAERPAQNQPEIAPVKRALILRIVELTNAKAMSSSFMDTMVKQMVPMFQNHLDQSIENDPNLTAEDRASAKKSSDDLINRLMQKSIDYLKTHLDFDELVETNMLVLYDKYFSEDELRGQVAFYESPAGRKMVEVMPQLVQESMAATVAKMQAIMPEYDAYMEKITREETDAMLKALPKHAHTPVRH